MGERQKFKNISNYKAIYKIKLIKQKIIKINALKFQKKYNFMKKYRILIKNNIKIAKIKKNTIYIYINLYLYNYLYLFLNRNIVQEENYFII